MGKKILLGLAGLVFLVGLILWALPESIQKVIYDKKADYVGTDRVATVYSPFHMEPLKTYADPDMRYDQELTGWTIWLGSINRKVGVSPAAIVIVEDVIK